MIMSYNVGDTVVLDGIESVIVYDAGSEQEWGRYLCVDKNHDLLYYTDGQNAVDSTLNAEDSSTISNAHKYGWEWGGYEDHLYESAGNEEIGYGLNNTDNLILLNLFSNTNGWPLLWNKVIEFREQINSNKWFVPSKDEIYKIFENYKNCLLNIIDYNTGYNTNSSYWTSTEDNWVYAYALRFKDGAYTGTPKDRHNVRVRLCRYSTDSELDLIFKKSISITCSTSQASIYYTTDNSTPNSNSNLYTDIFTVNNNSIIKAIGKKEGWDDSNIVVFDVSTQTTTEEEPIRQSETNKTINDSNKNI